MVFSVCKADEPIESIAFGSCLKQTRPQPIWESVLASKPDVFVLLVENIYGDTRDMEKLGVAGMLLPRYLVLKNLGRIAGYSRSEMTTNMGRTMPVVSFP